MSQPRGSDKGPTKRLGKLKRFLGIKSSHADQALPVISSAQATSSTTKVESKAQPGLAQVETRVAPVSAVPIADGNNASATPAQIAPQDAVNQSGSSALAVAKNEAGPIAPIRNEAGFVAAPHGEADPTAATPAAPHAATRSEAGSALSTNNKAEPIPATESRVANLPPGQDTATQGKPSQPPESNSQTGPETMDAKESLWYSSRTPKWNEAITRWKQDPKTKNHFLELEKLMKDTVDSPVGRVDFLSQLQPSSKASTKWRLRLKRCEPILNAAKGFVMPLANLDPHKAAPIICASVFFGLNIIFNRMSPENRDRMLDILFGCGDTIRECISFEMHFSAKSHPAIKYDIAAVQDLLPDQYLRALQLIYSIQSSCTDVKRDFESKKDEWANWFNVRGKRLWDELTDKIAQWESSEKAIKRHKDTWASRKKMLEEKLADDEITVKILKWFKTDDDPEPSLKTIRGRVMPDDRYGGAAQWLIDEPKFVSWCDSFEPGESKNSLKRVLWLRGGYGTGKTTLLYHTLNALRDNPEFHFKEGKELRIIPYFCDASKTGTTRPTYETIVRRLIARLSLLPDLTLAKPALRRYNELTSAEGQNDDDDGDWWTPMFKALIADGADQYHFVFLIDALDESIDLSTDGPAAAEVFLQMVSEVMKSHSNVSLLCSSHQQVPLPQYFGAGNLLCDIDTLEDIEVTAAATLKQMETFVSVEIEKRKLGARESAFYNPKYPKLQDSLKKALIDNARGMFRWVQVWLDILLPSGNDRRTIRTEDTAELRLEQLKKDKRHSSKGYERLEAGYQRLWELNALEDSEELGIRTRLFHFVLAALEPQSAATISDALRVRGNSYKDYPTPNDVRRLYSNFLEEEQSTDYADNRIEVRFVHYSARKFILNMKATNAGDAGQNDEKQFSDKKNHTSVLQLYMELFGTSTHPCWQAVGLDPSNWKTFISTTADADRLHADLQRWQTSSKILSFHRYLARYGLRHCAYLAEKRSVFDPTWTEVLERVIMNPRSAFSFIMLAEEVLVLPYADDPRADSATVQTWYFWGQENGALKLLAPHALACLDIIHQDDVDRLQPIAPGNEVSPSHPYLEDVAGLGGDIPVPQQWYVSYMIQKVTSLQISCLLGNGAAARAMLQAIKSRGDQAVRDLLFTASTLWPAPFCQALSRSYNLAETLLKFEKEHANVSGNAETADRYVSQQWSLPCEIFGRPSTALHLSIQSLGVDTLRLLEIAVPGDINIRGHNGETVLHKAARRGNTGLVRDLVETYGATIDTVDSYEKSPAFRAFSDNNHAVLDYFRSKGVFVNFDPEDKDMTRVLRAKSGLRSKKEQVEYDLYWRPKG